MTEQFDPRKVLWRLNSYYNHTFCYYAVIPDNYGLWHLHYRRKGKALKYHQVSHDIPQALKYIIHQDTITDEDVDRYLSLTDKHVRIFMSRGIMI